jgi:hypothetical protein
MPTVVRKDGFATGEPISLHVYQMSPGDLAHALQLVRQHQVLLVEVWRKLHGERSD